MFAVADVCFGQNQIRLGSNSQPPRIIGNILLTAGEKNPLISDSRHKARIFNTKVCIEKCQCHIMWNMKCKHDPDGPNLREGDSICLFPKSSHSNIEPDKTPSNRPITA